MHQKLDHRVSALRAARLSLPPLFARGWDMALGYPLARNRLGPQAAQATVRRCNLIGVFPEGQTGQSRIMAEIIFDPFVSLQIRLKPYLEAANEAVLVRVA